MIEILKPKILNNIINYPIKINNILYTFNICYTNYNGKLNTNIDGIVIMMISIAICNKWKIKSLLPIDSLLYDNLLNIVNVYKKYYHKHFILNNITKDDLELILDMPKLNRIKNNTNIKIAPISLGVDSLYTMLSNIDDITHLIHIINLDASWNIKNFNNNIIIFCKKYDKNLIIAQSNFKEIFSKLKNLKIMGTDYGVFTSDIILTASLYALSPECIYYSGFGKDIPCIMAQLNEINKNFKGNEFDSICNDILRIKKIKYILQKDSDILYFLRVCNDDLNDNKNNKLKIVINGNIYYTGIFNCGKCGKCTRTYTYLYMLNYHDKIKTFEKFNDKINGNYLDYYMINVYNKPNKILASTYYDMIFMNILKIYKDNNNNLDIIDNYDLVFENDKNIIIKL
jgi:hypothetical protein